MTLLGAVLVSLPLWGVFGLLVWVSRRWARADRARRARFQARVVAWVDQQRAWLRDREAAGIDPQVIAVGDALLDGIAAPWHP
jgi:hypothetical protein